MYEFFMASDKKIFGLIIVGFAMIALGVIVPMQIESLDLRMPVTIPFMIACGASFIFALILVEKKWPVSKITE